MGTKQIRLVKLHMNNKPVFVFLLLLLVSISSCDLIGYSKAISEQAEMRFNRSRTFINKIMFKGNVIEKINCENCDLTNYFIKIKIDSISEIPSLSRSSYNPYYEFQLQPHQVLTICVSKELFDAVEQGTGVLKSANSSNLSFDRKQMLLIGQEDMKWLPRS
ncbi:hypothetical protein [Chitinophaga flava]|uniref:Lipoprotein n=1 Tax=Chitinophaga flava TaxID=2259036 RepID=A0A365XTR9_9BACT|nr:hypothetical protein [Chitinophaga flava]RBL89518.1 hypothetical protein DF182_23695 [Chitinophaga flava]